VVVGGWIVLRDGRAFAIKNPMTDAMLRAIASELAPGRLQDWLLAQQSEAPGQWEAHVDVRELTPANAEAVRAAIRPVASRLAHGHNPYGLADEYRELFALLAEMVDAADRGDPPMDLNPHMRDVIPYSGDRSGPGWEHEARTGRRDQVKLLLALADVLLSRSVDEVEVARFLAELESFPPRELVRFDGQSRSPDSGLPPKRSRACGGRRRPATGSPRARPRSRRSCRSPSMPSARSASACGRCRCCGRAGGSIS
jgi:hypothetical protein